MEKDSLICQEKMTNKHTNKLSKWEETMITRQTIYYIKSNF